MGITVHREPTGRHRIAQVADPLHSRYAFRPTGRNTKRSPGRDTSLAAWQDPSVVLTEARMERIDAELTKEYERFRRTVSWSA